MQSWMKEQIITCTKNNGMEIAWSITMQPSIMSVFKQLKQQKKDMYIWFCS